MSFVGDSVEHMQSKIKREKGETDEELAHRLFNMQMEVYSAHAVRDLYDPKTSFFLIDAETRQGWIEKAKKWP